MVYYTDGRGNYSTIPTLTCHIKEEAEELCCLCADQGIKRLGISVPAIVVPVVGYPIPYYLRFRGALCHAHTAAFTIEKFTDYFGSWYDLAGDHLRSMRKPAVNPYPNDPSFDWEAFIINPNFEPVPKDQCYVQFWEARCLAAKGARQTL